MAKIPPESCWSCRRELRLAWGTRTDSSSPCTPSARSTPSPERRCREPPCLYDSASWPSWAGPWDKVDMSLPFLTNLVVFLAALHTFNMHQAHFTKTNKWSVWELIVVGDDAVRILLACRVCLSGVERLSRSSSIRMALRWSNVRGEKPVGRWLWHGFF